VSEPIYDPFIEQVASELRRPVRLDARFDERVMEAIEMPDVIPLHPAQREPWIRRPWTISITPVRALAAAAAAVALIALGVWREGAPTPQFAARPAAAPMMSVADAEPMDDNGFRLHQFVYHDPAAHKVEIEGDFNNWDGTRMPLTRSAEGMWSTSIPLKPGTYQYQFVVDDSLRVTDPTMPKMTSEFGSANSVIMIKAGRR
jgi:hypothetical protein